MGMLTQYLPQRFFNALDFTKTDESICSLSGHEAISLHYGLTYEMNLDEISNMKLIVYWGFNAAVNAPHLYSLSLKAERRGSHIIVVASRKSETAELADLWIQLKPGSDVTLTYGVMKHLIEYELVDETFLSKYTYGYDELKKKVSEWTISEIECYTEISWSKIEEFAEEYYRFKPSVTMIGIGMQKNLYGWESVRAVSLIPALIGFTEDSTILTVRHDT